MTHYYPTAPATVRHATGTCLYGWRLGGLETGQSVRVDAPHLGAGEEPIYGTVVGFARNRRVPGTSRPDGTPGWTVTLRGETQQGAVIRVTLSPDEARDLRDYLNRLVFPG